MILIKCINAQGFIHINESLQKLSFNVNRNISYAIATRIYENHFAPLRLTGGLSNPPRKYWIETETYN